MSKADVVVYMISGLILPVDGQIDKKIMTLLNNVALHDTISVEKQIATCIRQLRVRKAVAASFMPERHF